MSADCTLVCSGCAAPEDETELTNCPGCRELVCHKCGIENHMDCIKDLVVDSVTYDGFEGER